MPCVSTKKPKLPKRDFYFAVIYPTPTAFVFFQNDTGNAIISRQSPQFLNTNRRRQTACVFFRQVWFFDTDDGQLHIFLKICMDSWKTSWLFVKKTAVYASAVV